ncbi:Meiosis-specific protein asy1 [Salvia divinorum]|uniref:Meiosis-specific protein asy1 n=1 Tax=Salvia divinorum TaxID=28513 RepID=A0ABD1IDB0_SALDI
MVVAQKVKESEITEQDSLLLTRNLLRIAIFNISYIRGLFPEKYFSDKSVPALDMKIKKLMPMDAESRRLIDWMEKGVYDALQKKYLKTLLFCVCEAVDGPMIEEYSFSFSYSSSSDSQEVSMNINRSGTKKGGIFKHNSTTEITPSQMRSSACKMVRTLIQLMRTLDKMPEERTVLMKLLYYDDVTPMDYEPPFFRGCTDEEPHNRWNKDPLKMEVGRVNSKHLVLNLKVKSVLDPCEDENNDYQDDEISLEAEAESLQIDEDSESNSEMSNSDGDDQYIVAPVEKKQFQEDNAAVDEDNTQDPAEDEHQLERVKEWIGSYHLETVDLTDVLSNFPDISVVLIEDIMDKLVKENVVTKAAGDSYVINKKKNFGYEFDVVKEEGDVQVLGHDGKTGRVDHMYMKALYHTLPMRYITVAKLQNKLEGEASQGTVRKLLDKMAKDGYVEATTSNRRLGKRVIQSDLTIKKLIEVKKILNFDAMDVDNEGAGDKSTNNQETGTAAGNKYKDLSTCGGLHSIGSDITRTRGRSDANMNDSTRTENGLGRKMGRSGSTPTSRAEPAASRESFVPGADEGRGGDDMDLVMESKSTQDKRFRKTSTVKEPILQYAKRQKSVAV